MDENPAVLVKRLRVSRHEDEAWGDPGKGHEAKAGAGGRDVEAEPPEGPATGEGDRQTKFAEVSKELSG